jgi:hypothetical protein
MQQVGEVTRAEARQPLTAVVVVLVLYQTQQVVQALSFCDTQILAQLVLVQV